MTAFSEVMNEGSPVCAMLAMMSGCATTIAMAAIIADAKRVMMAGRRIEMSIAVVTGTIRSQGERLNVALRACDISPASVAEAGDEATPVMVNTISAMMSDGVVVIIIYLICLKRGTSAVDDARTVVSLISEILSPKYAPEIIAPAIHPSSKPNARPIPISATPIVAMVVHDEPVSREITAQITHDAGRKIDGCRIFKP